MSKVTGNCVRLPSFIIRTSTLTRPPKVAFIAPREESRVTIDPNTRNNTAFTVRLTSRGAMKATFGGRTNIHHSTFL
ncbi:MAG TPA: hypothetical protein VK137_11525, partial [Planctomycetaceae bacterium]|nr:hypothetical protein [Planctomycetaceae bacterium]